MLKLLRKERVTVLLCDNTSSDRDHIVGRVGVSLPNHQTVCASSDKMFARDVRVIVKVVGWVPLGAETGQLAVVMASGADLR